MREFITPNWHVILIHYPVGLLTIGVLIEILSFLWRRSSVRAAAKWMILIGALACIPTITLGIYAFRDVVSPGAHNAEAHWRQVIQGSDWSQEQWTVMTRHVWFAAAGSALAILGSIIYLASTPVARDRLRIPVFLVVLAGVVLISIGAWYSGEGVYRYGVAVGKARVPASPAGGPPPAQRLAESQPSIAANPEPEAPPRAEWEQAIADYVSPLQLHLLLAGITVALAVGALGPTIRRWWFQPALPAPGAPMSAPVDRRLEDSARVVQVPAVAAVPAEGTPGPVPYAARYWFAAFVLALLTAAGGLWLTQDWRLTAFTEPIEHPDKLVPVQRLTAHVALGVSVIILTLLLALITRVSRRQRVLTGFLMLLTILVAAGQIWMGFLLLYDSSEGPITGFFSG